MVDRIDNFITLYNQASFDCVLNSQISLRTKSERLCLERSLFK
ncbi:hypothetical protein BN1088_1220003 [Sphingobacterium sp. PM2-P1-29]|nr:hypothetical protein BN1088_1220003 [Sphingobacterium sp. PM2-P1-29]